MPLRNQPENCPTPPVRRRRRRSPLLAVAAVGGLVLSGLAMAPAYAAHTVSLAGSNFEIDLDANLTVDHPTPPSLDWLNVADTPKQDILDPKKDNSFGQGSKEDTPAPTVVDGSIPPNKSDLLNFSTYLETNANGKFLHMFWHRVQEPTGTTNMDFEFNQSTDDSGNGTTPKRTAGDLLIQYDLASGGTHPELFLSKWVDTGSASQCEASNTIPCWGDRTPLNDPDDPTPEAVGSINTSPILATNSGGLGAISARTFGEATVDFNAIVGDDECVSFGSAYLKSRSSDSFTAALKDFIAPAPTNITNCAKVIVHKETDPDEDPNATEFPFDKTFTTDPATSNEFTLTDDGTATFDGVFFGEDLVVSEDLANLPDGWELSDIDCDASVDVDPVVDLAAGTATFDLSSDTQVVECTFTNRAPGTIVVEKITDDGNGSFDFTSGTLTPSPFTLVTTGPGDAGKDSRTFADLDPGTYDVAEDVPANWHLVDATCDDGSDPAAIDLDAGETVTCTFHDARNTGSIKIVKTHKNALAGLGAEHPEAGVEFTLTGGGLAESKTATTNAQGVACFDGLLVSAFAGTYTVTETVPAGERVDGEESQFAAVATSTGCSDAAESASLTFKNIPLTDITVSADSLFAGGTFSSIECVDSEDPPNVIGAKDGITEKIEDPSLTVEDLDPGTYVCTVVIDP